MSRIDELIGRYTPNGVEHMSLGEVALIANERIEAAAIDETTYVGVDNLLPNFGGRRDSGYSANSGGAIRFRPGDVLIGNIRPYLKKVWFADRDGGASPDVLTITLSGRGRSRLTPKFLYYLLASDSFIAYSMQHAKGGKMPRGDKKATLAYRIPVPPLEIQREIVKVLDVFTELEVELEVELEAELEARRRQYAHYRDKLLVADPEVAWTALGDIATFEYGHTDRAQGEGRFRFIRITDINSHGKLNSNDPRFVGDSRGIERYIVEPGDLLMARTGATFGKTVLIGDTAPAVYASFLIRIRFKGRALLPSYYWHFAQSELYWSQANSLVGGGAQPQFNANSLRAVRVPIPSVREQQRVVELLDKFDVLVNDLSSGLPAEIVARRQQYEYYRDRLLTFEEAPA